jgi:Carboxypeptidase regulatory-like domain
MRTLLTWRLRGIIGIGTLAAATWALVGAAIGTALPIAAAAQSPRTLAPGRVQGTVYDSVAGRPLTDGTVELVSVRDSLQQRRATLGTGGRFSLDSLEAGPWVARFRHARLDSLALGELVVPVTVRAGRRANVALAVPTARALAQRACRVNLEVADTSGFLTGTLRRAEGGAPVVGETVHVQWIELVLEGDRPVRELISVDARTDQHGVWLACGVPANATVLVRATNASDSSGLVPVRVPASGIRYRDVYVGRSEAVAIPAPVDSDDTSALRDRLAVAADSLPALAPMRLSRGVGRLSGRVRDTHGVPLANARVAVPISGREVRTDSAGQFALDQLPAGTQVIEVRALGYDPVSEAVDIVDSVAPLTLEMNRFESLDTVRVRAQRPRAMSPRFAEFEGRRKMAVGTFFTSDEIERFNLLNISDLFARVGGIVMMTRNGERVPSMRGLTFRGRCSPMILVDGIEFPPAASLDAFVPPMSVVGVEVYSTAFTPGEFSRPFAPCGTIVIWTGARAAPAPRPR